MANFYELAYTKFGDPASVLSLVSTPSSSLEATPLRPNEAHVRVLCSTIHFYDIYEIQGVASITCETPVAPTVRGIEGVVEVVRGQNFQPGDRCVVTQLNWGCWKQEGIIDEEHLVKIPANFPLETAATLAITPCTAYQLLKVAFPLEANDVLIQNGANSSVGQAVIQLAKMSGIRTVNVIRNRSNFPEVVSYLKSLGADAVITTEQLATGLNQLHIALPPPTLALDCIGGQSSTYLAAALGKGGTLAVYGQISGQPVKLRQLDLISRDIRVAGYCLTNFVEKSAEKFKDLLHELISLCATGKLRPPKFRKYQLSEWQEAIKHATQGYTNEKVVLQLC